MIPLKFKPVVSSKKQGDEIVFNYKDPETLKRFMTESGNILNRERSGLSAKQQRVLAQEVKRARHIGLLPFVTTL
jgi:small subunit ribosomal protein S18